jgi:hypothetical protein
MLKWNIWSESYIMSRSSAGRLRSERGMSVFMMWPLIGFESFAQPVKVVGNRAGNLLVRVRREYG